MGSIIPIKFKHYVTIKERERADIELNKIFKMPHMKSFMVKYLPIYLDNELNKQQQWKKS